MEVFQIEKTDLTKDIREFNRFYTRILGLLNRYYLDSGYSLAEVRILFELNDLGTCTANDIIQKLKIDPSYMSRILSRFLKAELIEKNLSEQDNRAKELRLTPKGRRLISDLIAQSNGEIENMIAPLNDSARQEVWQAIKTLEKYLHYE